MKRSHLLFVTEGKEQGTRQNNIRRGWHCILYQNFQRKMVAVARQQPIQPFLTITTRGEI